MYDTKNTSMIHRSRPLWRPLEFKYDYSS